MVELSVMEKIPSCSKHLSLTVILLSITCGYVHCAVPCKEKLEVYGKVGDLVHFTICMGMGGSQTGHMQVNLNGSKTEVNKGQKHSYWYWNWKNAKRLEAIVEIYIWSKEVYYSMIILGFHSTAKEHAWEFFPIKIKNKKGAGSGVVPTDGTTPHLSTLTSSTSTEANTDCVDDLEAVGDIGGQVVFTICLDPDFPLGHHMEYRNLNHTFIPLGEGEISDGFSWEKEKTRDKMKILVRFSVSNEKDYGPKQVGFDDERTGTLKTFKLQITNGSSPARSSNPPTHDNADGRSRSAVVAGVVVVLIIIVGVVGFVVYKKKDLLASYINHITVSRDRKEGKQPHRHHTTDIIDDEEETVLSNPVYGMPKELGRQESSDAQVYHND